MKALWVLSFVTLASCAGLQEMQREWASQNCNRESAYEKGMNDGRSGQNMANYAGQCPPDAQAAVRAGYREGYTAGVDAVAKTTPGSVINVNFGGSVSSNRSWYCETQPFGTKFEAFGATQFEAKRNVAQKCTAKHHEIHCRDAECKLNN